jgi:hypothetical protein
MTAYKGACFCAEVTIEATVVPFTMAYCRVGGE